MNQDYFCSIYEIILQEEIRNARRHDLRKPIDSSVRDSAEVITDAKSALLFWMKRHQVEVNEATPRGSQRYDLGRERGACKEGSQRSATFPGCYVSNHRAFN